MAGGRSQNSTDKLVLFMANRGEDGARIRELVLLMVVGGDQVRTGEVALF